MKILQFQGLHLLLLTLLLGVIGLMWQWSGGGRGSYMGLTSGQWFVISLAVPIAHQLFVALCWRAELHYHGLSRLFGGMAFTVFGTVFFILFISRLVFICLLAISNHDSLPLPHALLYLLAVLISLPVFYTFYSVLRYFGLRRALGIDHFDISYRRLPLVHKGIFRYTPNAMYVFGLAILWLPGLLLASEAALLAALFNHLYIWVHYFSVEKPDMELIYARHD